MTKPGALPHWDLSNVYPNLESEQFRTANENLKGQIEELEAYCVQYGIGHAESSTPGAFKAKEITDGYITRLNTPTPLEHH